MSSCLEQLGEDDEELVLCQGLADAVALAFMDVVQARIDISTLIFALQIYKYLRVGVWIHTLY